MESSDRPHHDRAVRYAVDDGGSLVRTVTFAGGGTCRGYRHRCPFPTFQAVAHAVAGTAADGAGTTLERLAAAEGLAYTRVNVALEFLKDRGVVAVRGRRCYPATGEGGGGDAFLDAMTEYHALRERAPGA